MKKDGKEEIKKIKSYIFVKSLSPLACIKWRREYRRERNRSLCYLGTNQGNSGKTGEKRMDASVFKGMFDSLYIKLEWQHNEVIRRNREVGVKAFRRQ